MNCRQRRDNIISAPSLKRHHINQSIGPRNNHVIRVSSSQMRWHINSSASYCLQSRSDIGPNTIITSSFIIIRLVAVLFPSYRRQSNRCFNRTSSIYIYFHRDNTYWLQSRWPIYSLAISSNQIKNFLLESFIRSPSYPRHRSPRSHSNGRHFVWIAT